MLLLPQLRQWQVEEDRRQACIAHGIDMLKKRDGSLDTAHMYREMLTLLIFGGNVHQYVKTDEGSRREKMVRDPLTHGQALDSCPH